VQQGSVCAAGLCVCTWAVCARVLCLQYGWVLCYAAGLSLCYAVDLHAPVFDSSFIPKCWHSAVGILHPWLAYYRCSLCEIEKEQWWPHEKLDSLLLEVLLRKYYQ
jgi:hypothetical protein